MKDKIKNHSRINMKGKVKMRKYIFRKLTKYGKFSKINRENTNILYLYFVFVFGWNIISQ